MISGAHVVVYSKNAEADRAFFRDVLGFKSVDAGHGAFTVDNHMSARNHLFLLRIERDSRQTASPSNLENSIEIRLGLYRGLATLAITKPANIHISVKSTRFTTVYVPEKPHQFQLGRSTMTLEESPTTARNMTRLA